MAHCRGAFIVSLAMLLAATAAWADDAQTRPAETQQAQPTIRVYLTMSEGERVAGVLLAHDKDSLTVRRQDGETVDLTWDDPTPISAYHLRRRLVDLDQAQSHWELGVFLLRRGEADQARREFTLAESMDSAYAERIAEALADPQAFDDSGKRVGEAGAEPGPEDADEGAVAPPPAEPVAEDEVIRFEPVTPAQAEAGHARAVEMAEACRRTITENLHAIETEHFMIFSEWNRSNDRALRDISERMYAAMCRQFDIDPNDNIWVGKCPIFVFWEREHFQRFAAEVCGAPNMAGAGGFQSQSGDGWCYIVTINRSNRTQFLSTLVHEASHAFLGRYISNRFVPSWLNEGIAEYMAATVVEGSGENRLYIDSTRQALRDGGDIRYIFGPWRLDPMYYGLAQSLVRYLIHRDREAFIEMIRLIKTGSTDDEALAEAYGLTKDELVRDWARYCQRALGQ